MCVAAARNGNALESTFALATSTRSLLVAVPLLLLATADAREVAYHVTRCASTGEGQFAVAFEGARQEQRRLTFASNRLAFAGDVKGAAAVEEVRELRLAPDLEVVFGRPEPRHLKFGPVSAECRHLIRQAVGRTMRIAEGEADKAHDTEPEPEGAARRRSRTCTVRPLVVTCR